MIFKNKQVQKMLDDLHSNGVKSAVVAGGVVRDTLFGRTVKDIDIFISYEDWESTTVNQISYILGKEVKKCWFSGYSVIPDVQEVYDVISDSTTIFEGIFGDLGNKHQLPSQIVVMEKGMSPVQRIDTFDFGFCQVAYDGKNVITTPHFDQDYKNNTMTLVYCENQYEWARSMKRYERLKEKYPEFTLVAKPQDFYPELETKLCA